ncbi:MAG: hypothetical protein L3J96_00135, partial [Thermoplasmata archaeon]|nr:hypothetical protein [Thermoplasmata archaeon]
KLEGTPVEATESLTQRRGQIDQRLAALRNRLAEIAGEWYPHILALEEGFTIENRKLEVYTRLGTSKSTFLLEGWVPKRARPALEAALVAATGGRTQLYDLQTDEEPPTLMDNPVGVKWYEFFIRFYSLPMATEWDPTWVFAIVFPIFFAFMLGDWGYALVILLVAVWMIRGFPGRKVLPRPIVNFVKLIMGPNAMRQLAYALIPGTILGIGLGLLFDEFFGFHLLHSLIGYNAIVNPKTNIGSFLLLAGYVGLAMVVFGFVLGALNEYYHHHLKGSIAKLGGVAMAFGIAGFGLSVIHRTDTTSNPLFFVCRSGDDADGRIPASHDGGNRSGEPYPVVHAARGNPTRFGHPG